MTEFPKITLPWITTRVVELAIATLLVFTLTGVLEEREQGEFDSIPASDWFEVAEVYVPDHPQGSNPVLIYDRQIKRDFRGFWVAEVQRRSGYSDDGGFFTACSGSGTNDYEQTDWLDPEQVTWQWFLGRECPIEPGTYRIVTTYDMRVAEFPDRVKRYRVLSNVFTVTAD